MILCSGFVLKAMSTMYFLFSFVHLHVAAILLYMYMYVIMGNALFVCHYLFYED